MAAFKVFYAWQSDRPANLCRSLIQNALRDAVLQLEAEHDFDVVQRPEFTVEQDTQGEAGSPAVADTIFRKIRQCDAFVADLTFTGCRAGKPESPAPNPNVLIEYGYALGTLGHERIIAVLNEDFGKCNDLPFDIKHRRWPIVFRTSGDGADDPTRATRRAVREQLAKDLVRAIQPVVQSSRTGPKVSETIDARPLIEQIPLADGLVRPGSGKKFRFSRRAKILLSLRSKQGSLSLANKDVQRIAQSSLEPLASSRLGGWSYARVANGSARAVLDGDDNGQALTASMLLRDGSLFGIDTYHFGHRRLPKFNGLFIPTKAVESVLIEGLRNFLDVARRELDLKLPLKLASLSRVSRTTILPLTATSSSTGSKGLYS